MQTFFALALLSFFLTALLLGRNLPMIYLGGKQLPMKANFAASMFAALGWGCLLSILGAGLIRDLSGTTLTQAINILHIPLLVGMGALGSLTYLDLDRRHMMLFMSNHPMGRNVHLAAMEYVKTPTFVEAKVPLLDEEPVLWAACCLVALPLAPAIVFFLLTRMCATKARQELLLDLERQYLLDYPPTPQVIERPNKFGFMEMVPNPAFEKVDPEPSPVAPMNPSVWGLTS